MSLLDHPNIVRFFEEIPIPEKNCTCLVLEYIEGGELFDYIVARGKISEAESIKLFRQMISAIDYCHYHLVAHRDLKPENILLDGNGNVKITDFGLANIMSGELMRTVCGSPMYTAPEIIKGENYIGPEVDIWSLGVILYVMVTGLNPWLGENVNQQLEYACRCLFVPPNGVSDECHSLIRRILNPDPTKRATIEEIREHPWVNKGYQAKPVSCVPSYDKIVAHKDHIDSGVVNQLEHIGLNHDDIIKDITDNNKKSRAYVLYQLLIHNKQNNDKDESHLKTLHQSMESIEVEKKEKEKEKEKTKQEHQKDPHGHVALSQSAPALEQHPKKKETQPPKALEDKPLVTADLSSGLKSIFKGFGLKVSQRTPSNPNLKLSHDFTPEDLATIAAHKNKKIKVIKKHFAGNLTNRDSEGSIHMVETALNELEWNGSYKRDGFKFLCKEEILGDKLKFEIEICEVVAENGIVHHGMIFRRSGGSTFHYKAVITKLSHIFNKM